MAIFGSKKKTPVEKKPAQKKAETKAVAVVKPRSIGSTGRSMAHILSRPRITEKASLMVEKSNAYTFEIPKKASKGDVEKAIHEAYNIWPIKVTVTNLPSKTKFIRGKMGVKSGIKKAIVFLRKGDTIEFV